MQPIIQHNEQYTRLWRRINELVRKPRNRFEEMEMVQIDCVLTVADRKAATPATGAIADAVNDYAETMRYGDMGGTES